MSARYHAPAVAYDFHRPRWAAPVLWSLWFMLAIALLVWCAAGQWRGVAVLATPAVLLLAAWLLRRQWLGWPEGQLQWNGEHWLLALAGRHDRQERAAWSERPLQLRIGVDGGRWLWLEVSSHIAPQPLPIKRKVLWILLTQQHSPARWGDLRRAVYSSVVLLAEQG